MDSSFSLKKKNKLDVFLCLVEIIHPYLFSKINEVCLNYQTMQKWEKY